jgi:hypothetical protein
LMMNEFEIGSIREKNVCDSIKLNPKPLQMWSTFVLLSSGYQQ